MRISNLFFSSFLHFLATFTVMPIYLVTLNSLGNLHLTIGVAARQGNCHMFDIARFLRIFSQYTRKFEAQRGLVIKSHCGHLPGCMYKWRMAEKVHVHCYFLWILSETYILNSITLYISCFLNYLFFQKKIKINHTFGRKWTNVFSYKKSVKN